MDSRILEAVEKIGTNLQTLKDKMADTTVLWLIFFSCFGSCCYLGSVNNKLEIQNNRTSILLEGESSILKRITGVDSILRVRKVR